jgi:hypothetical protein
MYQYEAVYSNIAIQHSNTVEMLSFWHPRAGALSARCDFNDPYFAYPYPLASLSPLPSFASFFSPWEKNLGLMKVMADTDGSPMGVADGVTEGDACRHRQQSAGHHPREDRNA